MSVVAKTQIIEGRTYVVYTTGGGLVPGVTIAAMDEAPDGTWDVWVQDPATSHSRSYYGRKTRERAQAIVDRHLAKEGETVTAEETIGELPESIDLRPAAPTPSAPEATVQEALEADVLEKSGEGVAVALAHPDPRNGWFLFSLSAERDAKPYLHVWARMQGGQFESEPSEYLTQTEAYAWPPKN